jgi:hypothetical protein
MPMSANYEVQIHVNVIVTVAADTDAERTGQAVSKALALVSSRPDRAGTPYPSVADVEITGVTARRL